MKLKYPRKNTTAVRFPLNHQKSPEWPGTGTAHSLHPVCSLSVSTRTLTRQVRLVSFGFLGVSLGFPGFRGYAFASRIGSGFVLV